MREILFKAERLDNGKWIEGYYQKRYDTFGEIEHLIFYSKSAIVWGYIEINPDTLCQYTGLKAYWETIGKEQLVCSIWEHDLLEIEYEGNKIIVEVVYESGMFILVSNEFIDGYIPLFDIVQIEDEPWIKAKHIGNKFDNFELLEV